MSIYLTGFEEIYDCRINKRQLQVKDKFFASLIELASKLKTMKR